MYTAGKTDNLRKTGKKDRFLQGIILKSLRGLVTTSGNMMTKFERNRMYIARKTDNL